MGKHFKYLNYVIRHKWFVYQACRKCGVGLWQSIIHDWHKFLPGEWFPYVEYFYGEWRVRAEKLGSDSGIFNCFDLAWNAHQKRGKHHWQHWLLTNDSSEPKHQALPMPEKYAREMVADWWGAGRAITGNWDAPSWYERNKSNILIHPQTRHFVESLLEDGKLSFQTPENIAKRIRILGN
jgi:hypothetical protein